MVYPTVNLVLTFPDRKSACKQQRSRFRKQKAKLVAMGLTIEEYIDGRTTFERHLKVTIDEEDFVYLSKVTNSDEGEWTLSMRTYRQYDGPVLPEVAWGKAPDKPPSTHTKADRKRSRRKRRKKTRSADRATIDEGTLPEQSVIVFFTPEATLPHKGMTLLRGNHQKWYFVEIVRFDGTNFTAIVEDPTWPDDEGHPRVIQAPPESFRQIPSSLYKFIPNPFGPNHTSYPL